MSCPEQPPLRAGPEPWAAQIPGSRGDFTAVTGPDQAARPPDQQVPDEREVWTGAQCASYLGIAERTWWDHVNKAHRYRRAPDAYRRTRRALAPRPIPLSDISRGQARFYADEVRSFQAAQPGRGARTDRVSLPRDWPPSWSTLDDLLQEHSVTEVAKLLGVKPNTLHVHIRRRPRGTA